MPNPEIVCMVAGPDNGGKERNPMWARCRFCCTYCSKVCRKKCTSARYDFCAWRTDPATLVYIDLFGEDYAMQVYRENMKKKERWVGE